MTDFNKIFHDFSSGKLTSFYRHIYPGLLLYAGKILDPDISFLAEDCVQDAVMQTYSSRATFVNVRQWYSFILSCIRNRAISLMRKRSAGINYLETNSLENSEPDSSITLIEHETLELLYQAIRTLPINYREIVELSFEQGLKNAEIANLLGVAEITVKKQKAKIISILRNKLGGLLDENTIIIFLSSGASNFIE